MRSKFITATGLLVAAAAPVLAQPSPRVVVRPGAITSLRLDGAPRAAIGITSTSGSTVRDTLGVLVSSVGAGSPAEKAGVEEGNRIASVNGVNLKLAAPDVGDDAMAGIMARRLTRELD